ncbi:ArsR/SmtB family transcription factor [Achromobacter kerstersii]|jgi:DNA-binding transcriptional ArsR family regulator|uniref:ArsR/SmtB family transcription factor n=1 Tax=Achromobacter kerstersii TaxID=1353890 RepID=UPI0006C2516A|nr:metalloregulator ArsR/SmtB family transcription factor [Achromobacter kerstersii]CUI82853.1 Uncharacterized protein conserved in archaea [Achromobacter kerstersii]
MVELIPSPALDAVFRALADPTRRDMLRTLAQGDHTIGELAAPLRMSFAGASKHVQALERAGLIRRTIHGRTHVCSLNPEPMAEAMQWLRFYEQFWAGKLDALESAIAASASVAPSTSHGEQHE